MFKELQVIVDLVGESLTLKKFNLIGCKMRIYQERLKEINFVKLLLTLQGVQEEQDDGVAGVKPEKRMELY